MRQPGGRTYSIGALGLSAAELNVLGSMSTLSRARAVCGYAVSPPTNTAGSDIVIVNADDGDAVIQWRTLAVKPHPPVMVLYTSSPPADPAQRFLLRPFGPAKLLALLDSVAAELNETAQVWKKPTLVQPAIAGAVDALTRRLRALVIDDSPTVLKQLELELGNFNILVDCAETGEAALAKLAQSQYDIIFLDVVLPEADGYQVCKEIRKNPKTKKTPVIMLTSKSSPFDRVRGSMVGCTEYVTKPVDYEAFRAVVGKYVTAGA